MSRVGVSDGLREAKVVDISCQQEAQVGPAKYRESGNPISGRVG